MALSNHLGNEYLHEVHPRKWLRCTPRVFHGRIADFLWKEAGMDVKNRHAARAGTRTDSGGCRQYGCVDLVGSHGSSGSVG